MLNRLIISIPEPCYEKWEEMTQIEKGAFCKSCNKQVTDFSNLNDTEFINYFHRQKEVPTCGRFTSNQLNKNFDYLTPDVLQMNIPLWKKFVAIFFICFSSFIVGCSSIPSSELISETPPIPTNIINVEPVKHGNNKIEENPDSQIIDITRNDCNNSTEEKLMSGPSEVYTYGTFLINKDFAPDYPSALEKLFGHPSK